MGLTPAEGQRLSLRRCRIDGRNRDHTLATLRTIPEVIRPRRRLRLLDPEALGEGDTLAVQGRTLLDILQMVQTRRTLRAVIRLAAAAVQLIRGATRVGVTHLVPEVTQTAGALGLVGVRRRVEVIRTVGQEQGVHP
jgi:hypothetical protein